jgi:hypothetical protein
VYVVRGDALTVSPLVSCRVADFTMPMLMPIASGASATGIASAVAPLGSTALTRHQVGIKCHRPQDNLTSRYTRGPEEQPQEPCPS